MNQENFEALSARLDASEIINFALWSFLISSNNVSKDNLIYMQKRTTEILQLNHSDLHQRKRIRDAMDQNWEKIFRASGFS